MQAMSLPKAQGDRPGATLMRIGALAAALLAGLLAAFAITVFVAAPLLGYRLLAIESNSMSPSIKRGDLVVARPVSAAAVEAGDVVVFEAGGDSITTVHRVLGKNEIELAITDRQTGVRTVETEYRLVTKGDNNPAPDSQEVTADRLTGKVWFTVPAAGNLTGSDMRLLLGAIFLLVVGTWAAWEVMNALRGRRVQRVS